MILESSSHKTDLPPLSPENMTKSQLLEFIPKMLSLTEGRLHEKPDWWPKDATLESNQKNGSEKSNENENGSVDTLRQIVTKCYQYLGQADLLRSEDKSEEVVTSSCLETSGKRHKEANKSTNAVDELMDLEVEEIHENGFSDFSDDDIIIYSEDSETEAREPDKHKVDTGPTYLIGNSQNFKSHTEVNTSPSKPKLLGPKCARSQPNKILTQTDFLKTLGLNSTKQHELNQKMRRKEVNVNCDVISVSELETHQVCSPRSSKSLISQMSHDVENSSRKHLNFDHELDSNHNAPENSDLQIQGCLLRIPFSSHLGIRLKKYMRGENTLNIIYDPSEYCGTAPRPEFTDKLRIRAQDFPITFRRKKRGIPKHSHEIKFSRADKKKFLIRVKTGLTERSRQLKKKMKNCKVVLNRLTEKEIQQWSQPMFHDNTVWTIDDDISIVAVDIPMSNIKRPFPQSSSSHQYKHGFGSNPGSENPVVRKTLSDKRMECLVSEPRPCFLVKKVEKQFNENNGDSTSKMVYVPVSQHLPKAAISNVHMTTNYLNENSFVSGKKAAGNNRRKQNFQVRQELEDDVFISRRSYSGHGNISDSSILKRKMEREQFQNKDIKKPNTANSFSSAVFSGSSPVCHQKPHQSLPPCVQSEENKNKKADCQTADQFQDQLSLCLKISSVYSLQTNPKHTVRKDLGTVGCISSLQQNNLPVDPPDHNHRVGSTKSDSTIKASESRKSVISAPVRDKHPVTDDDDDCICIGEVITIDDDD